MKKLVILLLLIIVVSCEKEVADFTLIGTIDGLKKGTVYLERFEDSTYIAIDSLVIKGDLSFQLTTSLDEPEVLFLRLNKNDNDKAIIPFFAAKGVTKINSTLENFTIDAKIKGSKQQKVLEEYIAMMSKFNDRNLDLLKERFEAFKENDTTASIENENEYNSLVKRKYLYTINFAVNNANSEVAPYLALSEMPNVNPKFLDTIYNALTDSVKVSRYGKQLRVFLEEQKD
jgi:hypothetical protein